MLSTLFLLIAISHPVVAFNAPPGVKVWCGKAYEKTAAAFNPGGWLKTPPYSKHAMLDVRFRPRMSIYTADDDYGSFLVDAKISHQTGQPYRNSTKEPGGGTAPFTTLYIDIENTETGKDVVAHQQVPVGSSGNEFVFSLAPFAPRKAPYKIVLAGASQDGQQAYTAETLLHRLPRNPYGGSTVVLDSLHGSTLVPSSITSTSTNTSCAHLTPLFPYSFYASWEYFKDNPGRVQSYKDKGYNIVHVVPDSTLEYGFEPSAFAAFLAACDAAGLWVMYDMRWTYQNATSVSHQVHQLRQHKSLLTWYTADEPDGNTDPLDATQKAYTQISALDGYHPISLVLNCYNFHYAAYAGGADILLEDVYPIATNASFSTQWHTPCNRTYGDCGCDDCVGRFEDISVRLDRLAAYQAWLPGAPPKPLWGVPQAFGAETYWARYPTPAEELVMTMLRVNHAARGIVMWTWPTTRELAQLTGMLGKLLASEQVTAFTLGADPVSVVVSGEKRVDAAVWRVGRNVLVSVVALQYEDSAAQLQLTLPWEVSGVAGQPLLGENWQVRQGKLVKKGLQGLECDLFVVTVD